MNIYLVMLNEYDGDKVYMALMNKEEAEAVAKELEAKDDVNCYVMDVKVGEKSKWL